MLNGTLTDGPAAIPHGKKTHCKWEAVESSGQRALTLLTSLTHSGSHLNQDADKGACLLSSSCSSRLLMETLRQEGGGQLVESDQ